METVYAIREYPDELEADLKEFFGVDLLDLWRGRLSLRSIHVYIKSLMHKPGRSVLLAVMDETTQWGTTEHLLARVSDALELSNYLFLKANMSDAAASERVPLPAPIPRPGEDETATTEPALDFASGSEVSDFFVQMSQI
ncbi:hypothetical protein [Streptomyces sp. H39-S7]|uniref:hypothetical protein n=1 Tax=Streptomyces sp. H39-S7 TaxID=3004357 RepID=UPI0022AECCC0|nr:hypothetical protein [Streptomyces sp. H39-S7]MCZ4119037.1 hypothetical protein [Streptomyces sp. H39-S7]